MPTEIIETIRRESIELEATVSIPHNRTIKFRDHLA